MNKQMLRLGILFVWCIFTSFDQWSRIMFKRVLSFKGMHMKQFICVKKHRIFTFILILNAFSAVRCVLFCRLIKLAI